MHLHEIELPNIPEKLEGTDLFSHRGLTQISLRANNTTPEPQTFTFDLRPFQPIENGYILSFEDCIHNTIDAKSRQITVHDRISPSTFLLIFQSHHHDYIFLFALNLPGQRVYFKGKAGELKLTLYQNTSKVGDPFLIVGRSRHFHELLRGFNIYLQKWTPKGPNSFEAHHELAPWQKLAGWSSLEIPKQKFCQREILDTLWALQTARTPIHYVLIDPRWLQVDSKGMLTEFQANPKLFPSGLRSFCQEIRELGISHIGLCHYALGATNGLSPKLKKQLNLSPLVSSPFHKLGDSFDFYTQWYHFLSAQGISFIEIDAKSTIPKKHPRKSLHNALLACQAANSLCFNVPAFHKNTLHSLTQIASLGSTSIQTVSMKLSNNTTEQDLYKNILAQLLNTLWIWPASTPSYGPILSKWLKLPLYKTFHAFSCNTHLLSSTHDSYPGPDLFLESTLSEGQPLKSPYPLIPCSNVLYHCINAFPLCCYVTNPINYQLVLFNLSKKELHGEIYAHIHPEISPENYILYSQSMGLLGQFNFEDPIPFQLKVGESEVFTLAPIQEEIAVIGHINFLMPAAMIRHITYGNQIFSIQTEVKAPILIYSEREVLQVQCDQSLVPFDYDCRTKILKIDPQIKQAQSRIEEEHNYRVRFEP